jgi:DNA-binding transcriptional LysR family regulator
MASTEEARIMENRISFFEEEFDRREDRPGEPQPIGEVLAELLAQYRARFPEVQLSVVETEAAVC